MSMNQAAELIKAYSAEPIGQGELSEYNATYKQGNAICGDTIVVYLQIDEETQTIKKYAHAGEPQMFTLAAASMLAEEIEGQTVETVLGWGAQFMENLGLTVSPRRKRSTVSALLAVHNALYQWQGESKIEDYDQILDY